MEESQMSKQNKTCPTVKQHCIGGARGHSRVSFLSMGGHFVARYWISQKPKRRSDPSEMMACSLEDEDFLCGCQSYKKTQIRRHEIVLSVECVSSNFIC